MSRFGIGQPQPSDTIYEAEIERLAKRVSKLLVGEHPITAVEALAKVMSMLFAHSFSSNAKGEDIDPIEGFNELADDMRAEIRDFTQIARQARR